MIKFIHAADLHLDSPLKGLENYDGAPVQQMRQATRRALERLVDLAVFEAVDFVLIAGDLFDGDWRDYNTGLFFVSQASRLNAAGILLFIVTGNHDAAGRMTRSLPYPQKDSVFSSSRPETRILETLKVAIHGQSFPLAATMDNLARNYPEPLPGFFNIGLLHTSLTGRSGHEPYAPCTLADLQSRGYDYWALGHVHQFEIVSREPAVVFPGCIQGRHIRETGPKGGVLVTAAEGEAPEITPVPLDVIRWAHLSVDLSRATIFDEVLERFKTAAEPVFEENDGLPLILRIAFVGRTEIHGRMAADPEHLCQAVRAAGLAAFGDRLLVEKVLIETVSEPRGDFDPGPLRELEQFVAALRADELELAALGEVLDNLMQKMPPEYRRSPEALCPDDPERMRQLVDQAHALLAARLRHEEAPP
ncbi:MAG TPA: DNA repair exonuclease [Desulfobacteraceae bacterium]|nr:DNA repair exonuclease [Deltaproteobacteria bacterium]HDI60136.1 DNA repair exonuclease [Desulfobacteraceae bacterium]